MLKHKILRLYVEKYKNQIIMKNHILIILSTLFVFGQLASAQEIVVEQPAFGVRYYDFFEIEKIVVGKEATTLHIRSYFGSWRSLKEDIYLSVSGKEYPLLKPLNFESEETNGERVFSLVFSPIPAETERFDLRTRSKNWMIWDIELNRIEMPSTTHIPDEFIRSAVVEEDGKGLEAPQWKAASATLKGFFAGYQPEMNLCVEIATDNIVMGDFSSRESYFVDVNPDGTFEIVVPLLIARQVKFYVVTDNKDKLSYFDFISIGRSRNFGKFMVSNDLFLSPGEVSHICFDLPAYFRKNARSRYDKQDAPKIFYFVGANAEINNLYYDADYNSFNMKLNSSVDRSDSATMAEISTMTPSNFKERIMNVRNECIAEINAHPLLTEKGKDFFRINLKYAAAIKLFDISSTISMAINFNLPYDTIRDPASGSYTITKTFTHVRIDLDRDYYSFLNDLPLNNPVSLYFSNYTSIVNQSRFIEINNNRTPVSAIIGISEGSFFDLMACHEMSEPFSRMRTLTTDNINLLIQMKEPFFAQIMLRKNDELLARIEYNKSRQDYRVHDVLGLGNEELFEAIIGKEHGKVVLVNFWATRNDQCLRANEQLKPYKSKMNADQVAFVYLTNESSPFDTWRLMIPELSGEHYRLTPSQYNYMKKRLGIDRDSIPYYLALDKNGENVYRGEVGSPIFISNKINELLAK